MSIYSLRLPVYFTSAGGLCPVDGQHWFIFRIVRYHVSYSEN